MDSNMGTNTNEGVPVQQRSIKQLLRWWLQGEGGTPPRSSRLGVLVAVVVLVVLEAVAFPLFGVDSATQKRSLEHHGEALAFVGFVIGAVMLFVGFATAPENVAARPRWQAVRALAPIVSIVGIVGLGMIIAAH
jgi:hypothetical protein